MLICDSLCPTHTHTRTECLLSIYSRITIGCFWFSLLKSFCYCVCLFFGSILCSGALRSIWDCLPSNKSLEIQLYTYIDCMYVQWMAYVGMCNLCENGTYTGSVTDTLKRRTNWSIEHLVPCPSYNTIEVKNVLCRKWYLCRKKINNVKQHIMPTFRYYLRCNGCFNGFLLHNSKKRPIFLHSQKHSIPFPFSLLHRFMCVLIFRCLHSS